MYFVDIECFELYIQYSIILIYIIG